MNNEIKVLLVDDHAIMRKGLLMLLSEEADITVVGEAEDGEQAIERARTLQPDVVVMDISMPKLNGIEATRQIVSGSPNTRVIALSIHSSRRFVDEMLKAGASGYLLKESVPEELIQAIRAVMQGKMYLSSAITSTVLSAYMQQVPDESAEEESSTDLIILKSKLYPPTITPDILSRPKLMELLDAGRTRPLTLISAPAGYGKSTLIGSWLEQSSWPSAWLSLDQDDGNLQQFLNYLVTAVKNLFPQACTESQSMALASELPSLAIVTNTLSNELEAIEQAFFLALDDYHHINVGSQVNDLLQQLISRPPIPLHLVILSRRDPPLPLAKWRAEGQMTEIRMHDLKLSQAESQTLIENVAGLTIGEDALANLYDQLEGWPAGIRLVSLAMHQHEDPDEFLKHLRGGLQQTQEYLIQEVINNQSPQLRINLLKTSILDRFCAPLYNALCIDSDTVVSDLDGEQFIQVLRDGNLFVIPLDSRGEWLRYHHLFQLLLRHELSKRLSAGEIAKIHLQASAWFEAQMLIAEAIQHALAAKDEVTAADIIERHRNEILNQDKAYLLDGWLEKLPAELIQQRPVLLLVRAHIALIRLQFVNLAAILDQVESCLNDQADDNDLAIELVFFRGYLHFFEGNLEQSQHELEAVIKAAPEEPQLLVAEAELHLGLARLMAGNSALAIKSLNDRIANTGSSTGRLLSRLIASLAMIHLLSGNLHQLKFEARRLRELAQQNRTIMTDSWAYYLEGAADLQGLDLEMALDHFSNACKYPYATDTRQAIDAMASLALTQQLMQRTEATDMAVKSMIRFAHETNDPLNINVALSCEARIGLLQGNIAQAAHWAAQFNEPVDLSALILWQEVPQITQVRIMVLEGSTQSLSRASDLLGKIKETAETFHFTCQTIEVAVLEPLLLEKQGSSDAALIALQEALTMAETGAWIRPFIELGQPMAELLGRFAEHQGMTDFLRRVLDAFQIIAMQPANAMADNHRADKARIDWNGEQLTNRELDILELLAQRLQNKEIASRLFVSPETVKTHLKHLFQKLDVNNRREAAARAVEILASNRPV